MSFDWRGTCPLDPSVIQMDHNSEQNRGRRNFPNLLIAGELMPPGLRLDAPGVLQHVMARGIERRLLFRDDRAVGIRPEGMYRVMQRGHQQAKH